MEKDKIIYEIDYEELLKQIKEIRASERRFHEEINKIYKLCSCDYDGKSSITRTFYATVQNKLHWAITGKTAAELILERADSTKENMGLTSWKNSPDGKIRKSDVKVGKNYYNESELNELHNVVNMYLDYAERQAKLHKKMYMENWKEKLDEFLEFNDYEILETSRHSTKSLADNHAINELEIFKNS